MKIAKRSEGRTELLVPAASLSQDPPPTSPVFFNPAASLNRDVSVAIAEAAGVGTFCDSMAGVGARGVRIAKETAAVEKVVMVDFNGASLELARRSARINKVVRKCRFARSETSAFLASRYGRDMRFDMVDVDPFGTPIGEVQAALRAVSDGGVLSITATDTAVLCGVYPEVCERRYGAHPLNNNFNHETGVRILAGAVAKLGAMVDLGAAPVAAHVTRHYMRLFSRVSVGAAKADGALGDLGWVSWCPSCGHTASVDGPTKICESCGKKEKTAGPLWAGPIADPRLVKASAKAAGKKGFGPAARTLESLEGTDSFPPWSFSVEAACSALRSPTVPEAALYLRLREMGRRSVRTPFEKTGVKTDATYGEFLEAVKESSGGAPSA